MKIYIYRIFYFFVICVSTQLSSVVALKVSDLVSPNGEITEAVKEILAYTGVRIKNTLSNPNWPEGLIELESANLTEVTSLVQGKTNPSYSWFKGASQERWEMQNHLCAVEYQDILLALLSTNLPVNGTKGLDMSKETLPRSIEYTDVLLLGTTLQDFEARVNFLQKLVNEGRLSNTFQIYILTGRRVFNQKETSFLQQQENDKASKALLEINNEAEGMEFIYRRSPLVQSLENRPPIIINDSAPVGSRATTLSTILLYLENIKQKNEQDISYGQQPSSRKVLLISSHAFALYQYMIAKNMEPQEYGVWYLDVAAPSLPDEISRSYDKGAKIAILLDTLSRIYYEILKYYKKYNRIPCDDEIMLESQITE